MSPADYQFTNSPLNGPPHLKAILFDIDGTLTDSDYFHEKVFAEMLKPYGIVCDRNFYIQHISGKQNAELAKILLPQIEFQKACELFDHKESLFRQAAHGKLKPLDGLYDLLKFCKKHGIKTAAVTNAPRVNADFMLRELGLCSQNLLESGNNSVSGPQGGFDCVVIGSECEEPKPSPHPYLFAMKLLNVLPSNCLVFEDSISGCQAGLRAKVETVCVLTSQTVEIMKNFGIKYFIKNYLDLKFLKTGI